MLSLLPATLAGMWIYLIMDSIKSQSIPQGSASPFMLVGIAIGGYLGSILLVLISMIIIIITYKKTVDQPSFLKYPFFLYGLIVLILLVLVGIFISTPHNFNLFKN